MTLVENVLESFRIYLVWIGRENSKTSGLCKKIWNLILKLNAYQVACQVQTGQKKSKPCSKSSINLVGWLSKYYSLWLREGIFHLKRGLKSVWWRYLFCGAILSRTAWIKGTFKWILEEIWLVKTNGLCQVGSNMWSWAKSLQNYKNTSYQVFKNLDRIPLSWKELLDFLRKLSFCPASHVYLL